MMTNKYNTVLYTGVTNSLARRVMEHKTQTSGKSFTSRYSLHKLVYVEAFEYINDAITKEKQIKKGSRRKKDELIIVDNPEWQDLSDRVVEY